MPQAQTEEVPLGENRYLITFVVMTAVTGMDRRDGIEGDPGVGGAEVVAGLDTGLVCTSVRPVPLGAGYTLRTTCVGFRWGVGLWLRFSSCKPAVHGGS